MNAGNIRFRLTWSSLWHLLHGGTRLALRSATILHDLLSKSVLLVDVSKYQGLINFLMMVLAGIKGVIVKCGQGLAQDPYFLTNWKRAKDADMPRGSYWFYDSRVDPKTQALNWWKWIQGDVGELKHYLDLEENYGGAYRGWRNWKIFLSEFMRLSGLPASKIGIYTGYFYWIANSPMGADLDWFAQFDLWLAWYTFNAADVIIPKPWTSLSLWQFGTPAVGPLYGAESKEIDSDYFNGDLETYRNYFGLSSETSTGGTMTKVIQGTAIGNVTIRKLPGGDTFFPARYLQIGDRIEADRQDIALPQWLHLTKINDTAVVGEEWASAGTQQQYIKWSWVDVTVPPPPPADVHPVRATVEYSDGSKWEATQFTKVV